jgi:maltose alpha-D-glucosyltransferase/alpha-amylase
MIDQLRAARWFGGKSRAIRDTREVDRACWVDDAALSLVEVVYADGTPETYVLADRLDDAAVARALLQQFHGAQIATDAGGKLVFRPTRLFEGTLPEATEPISLMRGEQSNTSIRYGDALILKLFRRLQFGPNPDVEVGLFLTEHSRFRGTPAVVGSLDYLSADGRQASLALLQRFEANRGDAWTTTLRRLVQVLKGEPMADSVDAMARLAQTTGELHLALASGRGDFAPEPIGGHDLEVWRQAIHDELRAATNALAQRSIVLDAVALLARADGIGSLAGALKTRHHGDYHLGQVLERDDGSFAIIDFEGEPSKPLDQRREKRSPLRDVAGMLRSFDYARNAALRAGDPTDARRVQLADQWYHAARAAFLGTYERAIRQAMPELLPGDSAGPLAALELEKAAYEVLYELNNRPGWLPIPLAALTS